MPRINILDKDVYNKIAAGEVVEKPASVVKELVENSIDAGATNITIEIINGGITRIKVIDNGCGIEKDDFHKVFLAHATSKVKTIDDLGSIGTLGFRGEALSSIASVSRVTMSSKVDNDDMGYQIKVNGGELGGIEPVGATTGTYMLIEDLFYNIPARKKFLRKPKLEENDITNLISRLILANPNISIKYTADNKIIYQSYGTGLYNAIYSIYGKSIVDNIFEFEFKKNDFHFSGYLCKPTFSKPNRTYQTLIINGRYVINQTISTAIYKAYENFIMKGTFPFFVINLNIPLDKVDVNVHPNKLEVKFEDSNQIFGIVYSNVIDLLYDINNTKNINSADDLDNNKVDKNFLNDYSHSFGAEYLDSAKNTSEENIDEKVNSLSDIISNLKNTSICQNNYGDKTSILDDGNQNKIDNSTNVIQEIDLSEDLPYENTKSNSDYSDIQKPLFDFHLSSNKKEDINENKIVDNNYVQDKILNSENDLRLIGTFLNTYILVEKQKELLFIDQHAGHERILFDKFTQELMNKEVAIQPLLVPAILETNYVESNFIEENMQCLKDMGFEINSFGESSFKIETVPMLLNDINIDKFFDNILQDIDNKLIFSKENSIRDYIAKKACKSAVKGNDPLSENEINYLINDISKPGQVLLCPHGRPIIVSVTEKEIEKWFKRIV